MQKSNKFVQSVIHLTNYNYSYDNILKMLNVRTESRKRRVTDIMVAVRKHIPTNVMCSISEPYYKSESEMLMPTYNLNDLKGEELQILNDIQKNVITSTLYSEK